MHSDMKIMACQLRSIDASTLRFFKQLGVDHIQFNTPDIPGEFEWKYEDIVAYKKRVEEFDVKLVCIENVPIRFYDKVMLGLPGRDEQIENYIRLIHSLGRAGIPYLGYHFTPTFVWRTSYEETTRGGAKVSAFNQDDARHGNKVVYDARLDVRIPDEATAWANYSYFMKAILPEAEKAGVMLALHPEDPPIEMMAGVRRLFINFDNYVKADAIADSPNWGLDLCLGCVSEMPDGGREVERFIRHFGPRGKIFYVHFRDVIGHVPHFKECFLGEGNFDPAATLHLLAECGFSGFICDDHVPIMDGDSEYGHRARAYEIGKMQGMLAMMNYLDRR